MLSCASAVLSSRISRVLCVTWKCQSPWQCNSYIIIVNARRRMTNVATEWVCCLNSWYFLFSLVLLIFLCLLEVTQSLILTRNHECIFALHKFHTMNEWNLYSIWRRELAERNDGLLYVRVFRWGDTIWGWGIP